MKNLYTFAVMIALSILSANAQMARFNDNFDALTSPGWTQVNNTNPAGSRCWTIGITPSPTDPRPFAAYSGSPNSFVADNNVVSDINGNISNWLISPVLDLRNGATISFFTRASDNAQMGIRLQLRLSINNNSSDVGNTTLTVGDFTTTLVDINPNFTVGNFPETWTKYTVTLAGLPNGVTGRVAFRHFETGIPNGIQGHDHIGIDEFDYQIPATPLPVNFLDFNGTINDKNDVSLYWKTTNEVNNAFYQIERSVDGISFSSVGKVNSYRTASTAINQYNFTDNSSNSVRSAVKLYYRLKQVDNDGRFAYSSIVVLKLKKDNKLSIINQYVSGSQLNLQFNAPVTEKVSISIVDMSGRIVQTQSVMANAGANSITFSLLGQASSGIYLIRLQDETAAVTGKYMR